MRRPDGRPVIGLSLGFHDFDDYTGVGVQRPVSLAGGVPFILSRVDLDGQLDLCDGIVLAPGRDIEPARFGQEPSEVLAPTDPARDAFELDELAPRVLERGLPILGMCRGIQILNVALGGTLVQDLALRPEWAEHPSDRGWRQWRRVEEASLRDEPLPPHPRHPIAIEPASRLARALGADEAEVDSFHHQAVDRLAPGLRSVAWAPDGVVEAAELEGETFALAVQWELHEECRIDQRFLRIFEDFVAAAAGEGPSGRRAGEAEPAVQG